MVVDMRLVRALAAAVTISVFSASGAARAQAADQDVVTVTDGAVFRGRITELAGGDHVTVQLPDGQLVRIRWDAVAKLERASAPAVSPPPAAAQVPVVRVRIDSERPVFLQRVLPKGTPGGRYTPVCASPCDRDLPANDTYRIGGDGIRSSAAFTLRDTRGAPVELAVDEGSTGGFVGGIILTSLGGMSALVGSVLYLVGAGAHDLGHATTETRGLETGGAITAIAGLAMLVPGIILLANSSTTVKQHARSQHAASSKAPAWTKPAPPDAPAAIALPVVGGAF
jgi:hypothetical protein